MKESLTDKTVRITNWGLSKTLGQNVVAFFTSMVLARLIAPEEFGLLAIAMIFVGLGMILSNQGITPALVQKKELSPENIRAALLLSVCAGIFVFAVIWFIAPYAANFFNDPRATEVIRSIGIIFFFNGFSSTGRGLLMREFQYKPIFFIEVGAFVVGYGILGITLAALGYGVWSLVWGVVMQYAIMAFSFLLVVRITLLPVLRGGEYGKLVRFGGGVSILSFLNYTAMNIDNLIIGRLMDSRALGLYSKAFSLMQVPVSSFSHAIGSVSLSAFSSIQEEPMKLKRAFYKGVNIIFLFAAPLAVIMVISAEYLVLGVFGPAWQGAVEAFRILSVGILFKVFFGISGSVAKATNHVYKEAGRQLIFAACVGGFSLYLIPLGIEGVAAAVTLASVIFCFMMVQLSLKIFQGTWRELFATLKSGFVLALFVGMMNLLVIYALEYTLPGAAYPLKMVLILAVVCLFGLVLFITLPASLLGENRNWLISTYSKYLPAKYRNVLNRYIT